MKDFKTIEKFFEVEEAIEYLKKSKGLFIDSREELTDQDLVLVANSIYSLEEHVKLDKENKYRK